jgi:hypothetical protein
MKTLARARRPHLLLLIALLASHLLLGCGNPTEPEPPVTPSTPRQASVSLRWDAAPANEAPSGRYRGTFQDVVAVELQVSGDAAETVVELQQSGTVWSGTISDLSVGVVYDFVARAYADNSTRDNTTLLFSGQTQQTLQSGSNTLNLQLSPYLAVDASQARIPRIERLTYASTVQPQFQQTLSVVLQATLGDNLSYAFSSDSGLDNFTPSSGNLTVAAAYTSLVTDFTAPSTPGSYTYRLRVHNQQDLGIETSFDLEVDDTLTIVPLVVFEQKPSILGLSFQSENATHLQATLIASDAYDAPSALRTTWTFQGYTVDNLSSDNTTADNATFVVSLPYQSSQEDNLTVTVTNSAGDNTTLNKRLPVALFSPLELGSLLDLQTDITAGDNHSCALSAAGSAHCWGDNSSGQLGSGLTNLISISAGSRHTCALTATKSVACWGDNSSGQLGDGALSAIEFQQVEAGGNQSCGLTDNATVLCWGDQYTGAEEITAVTGASIGLSTGSEHACAVLDNGSVSCWGTEANHKISAASGVTRALQVSAGAEHTCAALDNGSALCWGDPSYGKLGNTLTSGSTDTPVFVAGLSQIARIEAGGDHTCAITVDNRVRCWGRSDSAQVGSGVGDNVTAPHFGFVSGSFNNVAAISTGHEHTCLRRKDDRVYCWGQNASKQTGHPDPAALTTEPFEVLIP